MSHVITGVLSEPGDAMRVIERLLASGLSRGDISVLASESTRREAFAVRTHTRVAEGAAIGAGLTGAVGALVAGLTAVGVIASGGLIGGPMGLGIPEHEASFVEDTITKRGVLVGVEAEGDAKRVAGAILEDSGAETVSRARLPAPHTTIGGPT